jgi:hypothetical protein
MQQSKDFLAKGTAFVFGDEVAQSQVNSTQHVEFM